MAAKTLIVSDLHLGNEGGYDIFAGGDALPALLARFAEAGNRVILNGDTIDFLMNEDPLELDEARAVAQVDKSLAAPATVAVMKALGGVLAAGGEVVMRLGNHDIELALHAVQERVRAALHQPPEIAAKLRFERGDKPAILNIGGARILVTHGEQNDPWNEVNYKNLPGPDGPEDADAANFTYAAGSKLVKTIMNPLKRQYGLRFVDLVKPDFQGGVLSALAVSPTAVKTVFKGSTLKLMWQLFRQMQGPATFEDDEDEHGRGLGLSHAVDKAGLTKEEREALIAHLHLDGHARALSFSEEPEPALEDAKTKLARAGLHIYASAQKSATGTAGERYFQLDPTAEELKEAGRLAQTYGAEAVIFGHTHAARWQATGDLAFVNTGTWIWLMSLPAHDAPNGEWEEFLQLCRSNPRLDPAKGKTVPLHTRFTAAVVEPHEAGGAQLSLIEWTAKGELQTLGEKHIRPAQGAKS